ncbi:MAG: replicative DNA helicase [Balneolales bacterium]|nr:replicative DNA helicase [Balneolales bacterium]
MYQDNNNSKQNDYRKSKQDIGASESGILPPQATEIEEAVLGGMLIEHEAATTALELLKSQDFYKKAHRHIFEIMSELYENNNPLDFITVENELRDRKLLEECGGPGYLTELTRSVSSAANIEYHAQILIEKAIKRNIISAFTDVIKESYESSTDPFELLDKAEKSIFELANSTRGGDSNAISDILKKTLQHLEEIRGQKGGITGVPTGLDLDKMTAGWQPGDLVIIAARPSMGKTAFVLTVARNAALFPDVKKQSAVAIFSLEMSDQQLVQRLLTMEARVDAQAARTGRLQDDEFKRLIEAASRLFKARIFIDDTPALSIMEMRSKCRRLKSEHDIDLIIVDYLQLMRGNTNDRNSNREQEIAMISRSLKGLAKELNVPVIALAQLSRAVEQRGGNKRPMLSDLRESGSIEQDADVVCFLYRPEYYGITTDDEGHSTAGIAEVIIGKQRNGPVGDIKLQFVKEYARFENLSQFNNQSLPNDGVDIDPFMDDEPSSQPQLQTGGKRPQLPPAYPDQLPDEESPF